jgi:hypothetical protein
MPEYQIHSIGLDGYATTTDDFECATDRDAIKKTLQITEGHDRVVGARLLYRSDVFQGKPDVSRLSWRPALIACWVLLPLSPPMDNRAS